MRKELGIDGNVMLWLDVRENKNGTKEIVIKKPSSSEEIFKKYKTWAEVISRISECSVALVWNNRVLSMSSSNLTESFLGKNVAVSPLLSLNFKKISKGGVIVNDPKSMSLLSDGSGNVSAYFKVSDTCDDSCFFVIVKGTKYDVKRITKAEEARRYQIINDIMEKI
jgi:hypothetical protein